MRLLRTEERGYVSGRHPSELWEISREVAGAPQPLTPGAGLANGRPARAARRLRAFTCVPDLLTESLLPAASAKPPLTALFAPFSRRLKAARPG